MPRDWMDLERDRLLAEADRLSAAQRQEWADKVAQVPGDDNRGPQMPGLIALVSCVALGAMLAGHVWLTWMIGG